jgi:hypothetical protein
MKSSAQRGIALLLTAVIAVMASETGAAALECPALQSLGGETAGTPDLSQQLASKDVLAQVPGLLGTLHAKFPSASNAQLVNYLIAAYCPVVKADAALSDQEKMGKVKEFADKVVSSAY